MPKTDKKTAVLLRSALRSLFALLLTALLLFSACKKGGEPAVTAQPDPEAQATPLPEGPFELFDFVKGYDANTAEDLARLALLLPGVEAGEDRQFADAYFEGSGVILGLDLSADEFDPVLFCRNEGSAKLTVRGIAVGMTPEELAEIWPEIQVNLGARTAYMDFSDTEGVELAFDDEFRVSVITYSVTR